MPFIRNFVYRHSRTFQRHFETPSVSGCMSRQCAHVEGASPCPGRGQRLGTLARVRGGRGVDVGFAISRFVQLNLSKGTSVAGGTGWSRVGWVAPGKDPHSLTLAEGWGGRPHWRRRSLGGAGWVAHQPGLYACVAASAGWPTDRHTAATAHTNM